MKILNATTHVNDLDATTELKGTAKVVNVDNASFEFEFDRRNRCYRLNRFCGKSIKKAGEIVAAYGDHLIVALNSLFATEVNINGATYSINRAV